MVGERELNLVAKAPQDLYGREAGLLKDVERVFRVANNIDYIRQKAEEKGFIVSELWSIPGQGACFIISEKGQKFEDTLPITEDPSEKFIWVTDLDLERFQDLIGIDKRMIEGTLG